MKFNEYNVMKFAFSPLAVSHEGYMSKQGADLQLSYRPPTFKKRYFVLKGNLLFYFKERNADLIGFILVEDCQVTWLEGSKFCIHFEVDERSAGLKEFSNSGSGQQRKYVLSCSSEEECRNWMKKIRAASLTASSQAAMKENNTNEGELAPARNSRSSVKEMSDSNLERSLSTVEQLRREAVPEFQRLAFSVQLKVWDGAILEKVSLTIQVYNGIKKEWKIIDSSENFYNFEKSSSFTGTFIKVIELERSVFLGLNSVPVFRIYLHNVENSNNNGAAGPVLAYSEIKLMDCINGKRRNHSLEIDLSPASKLVAEGKLKLNFLWNPEKRISQLCWVKSNLCSVTGYSLDNYHRFICQSGEFVGLMLSEPDTCFSIPYQYLTLLHSREMFLRSRLQELYLDLLERVGRDRLSVTVQAAWKRQSFFHDYLVRYFATVIDMMGALAQGGTSTDDTISRTPIGFRRSPEKKEEHLQWIPVNMQTQVVMPFDYEEDLKIFSSVSCGVCAGHFFGFKRGGLSVLSRPWLSAMMLQQRRDISSSQFLQSDDSLQFSSQSTETIVTEAKLLGLHHIRVRLHESYNNCVAALDSLLSLWKGNLSTPLSRGPNIAKKDLLISDLIQNSLIFVNIVRGPEGESLFSSIGAGSGDSDDFFQYSKVVEECNRLKKSIEADLVNAIHNVWQKSISDYENICLTSEGDLKPVPDLVAESRSVGDWMQQFAESAREFRLALDRIKDCVNLSFERQVLVQSFSNDNGNSSDILGSFKKSLSDAPIINSSDSSSTLLLLLKSNESLIEPISLYLRQQMVYCQFLTLIITCFRQTFLSYLNEYLHGTMEGSLNNLLEWIWQCQEVGFLASMEALLSWTNNDELGMLQDMLYLMGSAASSMGSSKESLLRPSSGIIIELEPMPEKIKTPSDSDSSLATPVVKKEFLDKSDLLEWNQMMDELRSGKAEFSGRVVLVSSSSTGSSAQNSNLSLSNSDGPIKIKFIVPRILYRLCVAPTVMSRSSNSNGSKSEKGKGNKSSTEGWIRVIPILYGKGINEGPSGILGVSSVNSNSALTSVAAGTMTACAGTEDEMNALALKHLNSYQRRFEAFKRSLKSAERHAVKHEISSWLGKPKTFPLLNINQSIDPTSQMCRNILDLLSEYLSDRKKKKAEFLILAQVLTGRYGLRGGRITFCKSGKDRTAMSTTLEQAIFIRSLSSDDDLSSGALAAGKSEIEAWVNSIVEQVNCNGWPGNDFDLLVRFLRGKNGLRLPLVWRNTGSTSYNISSLQQSFIPRPYRPIIN